MSDLKLGVVIGRSFSRTGEILFRPFSLKKWLRLMLIAFIAGAFSYSGLGQSGSSRNSTSSSSSSSSGAPTAGSIPAAGKTGAPAAAEASKGALDNLKSLSGRALSWAAAHKGWVFGGGAVLLLLALLLIWLRARFEFVWFNAVRENTADISAPFDIYVRQGNSLFKLYLLLAAGILLFLAGMTGWGIHLGSNIGALGQGGKLSFWSVLLPFLPFFLVMLVAGLAGTLFSFFFSHVVVTLMGMDDSGFWQGFGKALGILNQRKMSFFLFFLVWIGLQIAAGIAALIVSVLVILVLLAVGALFGGLLYLLMVKALGMKILFFAAAALAGIPFVLLAILLLLSVQLPVAVFFRSLSMYFLSSLDCGCAPLPLEPEPS